jgi:glycosyltransferase involved in cell wall biosynthesis
MSFLIIQIPCLNEEAVLLETLRSLPRELPGVRRIEIQIIDDGSTDRTVEVARGFGVDHIVRFATNRGLAAAFSAGIKNAIARGADVIVNTDADNQYSAKDIVKIVEPIIAGKADIVIGARQIDEIAHFSPTKRFLQKLGSGVVRSLSGTAVRDAPSGFRAISRDAAKRLFVYNEYTYTLETIIQAGQQKMRIVSVPVAVNEVTRPSRLISSVPNYIWRSIISMGRSYLIYRPFRTFSIVSLIIFIPGFLLLLRFLWNYLSGSGNGFLQSLLIASVCLVIAALLFIFGLVADLIAVNRRLLEDIRYEQSELRREDCRE